MILDPNVEYVNKVRQDLIERYGGLQGYFEHLQELGRKRAARAKKQKARSKRVKKLVAKKR